VRKKKVRVDFLLSELRRQKLIAYSEQAEMSMTQVIEFLIDTLKIKRRKRNADDE
jgi:hypothetical protein